MNFALALASNRIPGTRVNLRKLNGDAEATREADKIKLMDQFLNTILGGDISKSTRETLLKQLDQQTMVSVSAPSVPAEPSVDMGQMTGPGQGLRQRPRAEANINDPVTKVVGLILGTPEFQRQ
jgi:hypothetical protein